MRNQLKTVYSVLALVATLGLTSTVHGVPTFARQTGLDCTSCHAASGFPTLNSFGAAFKAGGYSQANEDDLVGDGETLSIPKALNVSVVLKALQPIEGGSTTVNGTTTDNGVAADLVLPDEMALLIGGRLGTNSGFLIESALGKGVDAGDFTGGNAALGAKYVFAPELGPVRLGIVPWWTDLGAGYVFESLSTGAINNLRAAEEMKGAAHRLGMNDLGQMTGLGLYLWHPMGFVAFTPFFAGTENPANGTSWVDSDIGYYVRAAATPSFGSVNLGIGVQYWAGVANGNTLGTFVVDAQAMMDVGIPLSIFATFGMDNSVTDVSKTSLTAYVEAAIVPDTFMTGLAFTLGSETVGTDTATDIGIGLVAKYHIFRNLKFELDVFYDMGSNSANTDTTTGWLILPMIFGAF
jgi:hypothetical protein